MNPTHIELPTGGGYHRPYQADPPDTGTDVRSIHSLPYCDLIEAITEILFPENTVKTDQGEAVVIKTRDVRVDRYILFRAVWESDFAATMQRSLADFTDMCRANWTDRHFVLLTAMEQQSFLDMISKGTCPVWTSRARSSNAAEDQTRLFAFLHTTITGGMLGEPGYGGNYRGIGWYYSNFITAKS
jgi:hypothetical protein